MQERDPHEDAGTTILDASGRLAGRTGRQWTGRPLHERRGLERRYRVDSRLEVVPHRGCHDL